MNTRRNVRVPQRRPGRAGSERPVAAPRGRRRRPRRRRRRRAGGGGRRHRRRSIASTTLAGEPVPSRRHGSQDAELGWTSRSWSCRSTSRRRRRRASSTATRWARSRAARCAAASCAPSTPTTAAPAAGATPAATERDRDRRPGIRGRRFAASGSRVPTASDRHRRGAPRARGKWLDGAVEEGGGTVVPPEEAGALVWGHHADPEGLIALLDAHPQLEWVQLPWAGIEPYVDVVQPLRRPHVDLRQGRLRRAGGRARARPSALAGLRHLGTLRPGRRPGARGEGTQPARRAGRRPRRRRHHRVAAAPARPVRVRRHRRAPAPAADGRAPTGSSAPTSSTTRSRGADARRPRPGAHARDDGIARPPPPRAARPRRLGGQRRPRRPHRHRRPRRRARRGEHRRRRPRRHRSRAAARRPPALDRAALHHHAAHRQHRSRWPSPLLAGAGARRTCAAGSRASRCSARSTSPPATDRRPRRDADCVASAAWTSAARPSPPSPPTSAARRISARELVDGRARADRGGRPAGQRVRRRRRRGGAGRRRRRSTSASRPGRTSGRWPASRSA